MTRSEIRRLKPGSKYKAITPFGCTKIRKVHFVVWVGHIPYIIFYGKHYDKRNYYYQLTSDNYTLIKL